MKKHGKAWKSWNVIVISYKNIKYWSLGVPGWHCGRGPAKLKNKKTKTIKKLNKLKKYKISGPDFHRFSYEGGLGGLETCKGVNSGCFMKILKILNNH